MELLQLEHFLAIVNEGTFTRAAECVYRTQPALSQSIKKLEGEVGAVLFVRDVSDLTLTEAGKHLVDYARRMLALRDEAAKRLTELKNLKIGALSIAAHESAAIYLLPRPLRDYFQVHPLVKISVCQSSLEDIPRKVMTRDFEIGFVKERPNFRELECMEVYSDRMVLIASPHNPLALCQRINVTDLDERPFVVHHQCGTTERIVMQLFADNRIRCNIIAELWNFENVKNFVQADLGLAIVPRITVIEELRAKSLVEIKIEELCMPRKTLMIYRSGYLSDSARELVNIFRTFDHRSQGGGMSSDLIQ
jgi:DNA-binding transcriptional LysR family regulator